MTDSGSARKKLCVYISGQARHFEDALATTVRALADFDTTYVVSLWRDRGVKMDGALTAFQFNRMFSEDVARAIPPHFFGPAFHEKVPALRHYLDLRHSRSGTVRAEDIRAIVPDAIVDIQDDDCFDAKTSSPTHRNQERMLYKIWRCNQLRHDLEVRRKVRFDWILRLRPDVVIRSINPDGLDESPGNDKALYVVTSKTGDWVDDNIYICRPASMDLLSDIETMLKPVYVDRTLNYVSAHGLYLDTIRAHGITCRPLPLRFDWMSELMPDEEVLAALHESEDTAQGDTKQQLASLIAAIQAKQALRSGNAAAAVKLARQAMELDPAAVAPRYDLARALAAGGKPEQALPLMMDAAEAAVPGLAPQYIYSALRELVAACAPSQLRGRAEAFLTTH